MKLLLFIIITTGCVISVTTDFGNYVHAGELDADKQLTWAKEEEIIKHYKSWLESEDMDFRQPIVWAAMEGNMLFVEMFIRHGEEIDKEEEGGGNALSAAILNENIEIFNFLMDNGADIHITYSNKMMVYALLSWLPRQDNIPILSRLIDLGTDINYVVPDKYETTALYQALFHDHIDAAGKLIGAGAQFRPYILSDGTISERVQQNACLLKERYPDFFKEVLCD